MSVAADWRIGPCRLVNPPYTFLVLDDDEDSRFLARHALERAFPGARVLEFSELEPAIRAAAMARIDGVVTDHHLGTDAGAAIIRRLRESGVSCPVVMVTASSDPAVYHRAYDAGAARVFVDCDADFIAFLRQSVSADRAGPRTSAAG